MNELLQGRNLAVIGPTASGKSLLAALIAETIGGEIISADSVQVFKHLDILSAKPSQGMLAAIPHHLISIITPDQQYNAGKFSRDALEAITLIHKSGRIPVISGGTALYIKALTHGLIDAPEIPEEIRQRVAQMHQNHGLTYCRAELEKLDAKAAAKFAPQDKQRILRALEVCLATGGEISQLQSKHAFQDELIRPVYIMYDYPRETIYSRINQRTEQMATNGGIEEVRKILDMGYQRDCPGLSSIGYKQITEYLMGERSLQDALEETSKQTRRYAKRQLTWYRQYSNVLKLDPSSSEKAQLAAITQHLEQTLGN